MLNVLIWAYIINSTLLIVHEIDSAYWQEWKLFRLRGGLTLFLCLHIPLVIIVLYGLLLLSQNTAAGLRISLFIGAAGIFAFIIHMFFIARGRNEFKVPISIAILIATLVCSIAQVILTVMAFAGGISVTG